MECKVENNEYSPRPSISITKRMNCFKLIVEKGELQKWINFCRLIKLIVVVLEIF